MPDTAGDDGPGQVAYLSPAERVRLHLPQVAGRRRHGRTRSSPAAARRSSSRSIPSTPAWTPRRPGLLLFTARYGDRDALIVWDLQRRQMRGRYQFPELVSLLSPHWMPDGRSIVLSGLSRAAACPTSTGSRCPAATLEPLTNDRYQDLDPSPSADGRRLVFASDRTADGRDGAANLFLLDLGHRRDLASSPPARWVDESPVWGRRRPDLLHLRPRRRAQRLLRRHAGARAAGDLGLDRRVRRRCRCRERRPAGRRVPRPELEPLSHTRWTRAARRDRFAAGASPRRRGSGPGRRPGDTADQRGRAQRALPEQLTLDFAAGDAVVIPGYGGAQGVFFVAERPAGRQPAVRLASPRSRAASSAASSPTSAPPRST